MSLIQEKEVLYRAPVLGSSGDTTRYTASIVEMTSGDHMLVTSEKPDRAITEVCQDLERTIEVKREGIKRSDGRIAELRAEIGEVEAILKVLREMPTCD